MSDLLITYQSFCGEAKRSTRQGDVVAGTAHSIVNA
jgi:hypothetical protein